MTEKEKMGRQMLYDANFDRELMLERQRAKELCYDFIHTRPSDAAGQDTILRQLIGSNVVIGGGSVVTRDIPDNCVAAGNPCRVVRASTGEDSLRCYDRLT